MEKKHRSSPSQCGCTTDCNCFTFKIEYGPVRTYAPEDGRAEEYYRAATEDPVRGIELMEEYLQKEPHNPLITQWLHIAYEELGQLDKARDLIVENYRIHPEYLLNKTMMAQYYMGAGDLDKVLPLFNGDLNFTKLYPKDTIFSFPEVYSFFMIATEYYCLSNKLEIAKSVFQCLLDLHPNPNEDPNLQSFKDFIYQDSA